MRQLKAFTLIELLVVISIIAMLLSILMPGLRKAKDLARRVVCATNMKTLGVGDIMYAMESNDWHVPAYYYDTSRDPPEPLWFQNSLFAAIVDLKGRKNKEDDNEGFEGKSMTLPKDFKCPKDKRTIANGGLHVEQGKVVQGVSYAMNMMGIRPTSGWASDTVYALKATRVKRPAGKIFFMDGQWFVVYRDGAEYKRVWDVYGDKMGAWEWDAASYRHNEGANITFYDGSVGYLPKEKICPYLPGLMEQMKARNAIWMPTDQEFFQER
jgi:prepilin-type N-terminal cleavage/methylation domain-containing protein/prepilin-type processing-associated H-X9-DG protein